MDRYAIDVADNKYARSIHARGRVTVRAIEPFSGAERAQRTNEMRRDQRGEWDVPILSAPALDVRNGARESL